MNLKLSVFTNRVKGKSGFAVCVEGEFRIKEVGDLYSHNIKEDVLFRLAKGLRACRGIVSHEDILYIEIQNRHLQEWLEGKVEYKGYSDGLDEAFEALETLDCRYKFMFVPNPIAKHIVNNYEPGPIKGSSVEDMMSDL